MNLTPRDGAALRAEQAKYNDGRGSTVARTVAFYLERGDVESAKVVWHTDSDKVVQFQGLREYMNKMFGTDW